MKHSKYAPSAAHRWLHYQFFYLLSTEFHTLNVIEFGCESLAFDEKYTHIKPNEVIHKDVYEAFESFKKLLKCMREQKVNFYGMDILIEPKIFHKNSDRFGTPDILIKIKSGNLFNASRNITFCVVDLKFGFNAIEVVNNDQLEEYVCIIVSNHECLLEENEYSKNDRAILSIIQNNTMSMNFLDNNAISDILKNHELKFSDSQNMEA